ncbi:hypothetical protein B0T19DRAFT_430251 [Cercophora scortea]|uniref:Uncharacterized protein n=1 Tax=Cercophora scortea TaxID=314031 RepID=A0AAE0I9E0_9PEZI|nr:hypothetical protein B0T19DRAFT_430251 [Cercophora scortea]
MQQSTPVVWLWCMRLVKGREVGRRICLVHARQPALADHDCIECAWRTGAVLGRAVVPSVMCRTLKQNRAGCLS